jgi:hypothetical protein
MIHLRLVVSKVVVAVGLVVEKETLEKLKQKQTLLRFFVSQSHIKVVVLCCQRANLFITIRVEVNFFFI